MEERKRRTQLGLPELYLYGKETKTISYNEFVNRELILFSNMDNERSIPSLIDGELVQMKFCLCINEMFRILK
jgi:DNA topoisomerase-2